MIDLLVVQFPVQLELGNPNNQLMMGMRRRMVALVGMTVGDDADDVGEEDAT